MLVSEHRAGGDRRCGWVPDDQLWRVGRQDHVVRGRAARWRCGRLV